MTVQVVGPIKVGDSVSMVVPMGAHRRLRCPVCHHFTKDLPQVQCACGAEYRSEANGSHVVVRLP